MQIAITLFYYALTAFTAILLIWNFLRRKRWQDEILYLIILIPFLLRLMRLK